MNDSKLIVISMDALVGEDLEYFRTLPNFRKYLAGGCECPAMRSIYPSVTYPCHVSMSTGCYPGRHGITSNLQFLPGHSEPLPWQWFSKSIRVPDLFTAAKQAGKTTAAVFWPVTGNHPDIDYLVDEYWSQGLDDTPMDAFARSGTSPEVLQAAVLPFVGELQERKHPSCDYFITRCASAILRTFRPDLLMIHPANIDAYRHQNGLFHEQVRRGIEECDVFLGRIAEAAIDAGVWENTNLVMVSDHGQINVCRSMNLNVFFAEQGLISVNSAGEVTDWEAWCQAWGASACVVLRNPSDRELYDKVYSLLLRLRDDGLYGFERVWTEEEAWEKEHLRGNFSFVLETDGYTTFGENWQRPMVRPCDNSDYRAGTATHGHDPDKGPQPIFCAKGPAFRENVHLERGRLVDEAPTFAQLLGTSLPEADGQVMWEFLRDSE